MRADSSTQGMALAAACLGIFTFASMDALMKDLSLAMGAYNALLWRTILALLMSGVLFFVRRSPWPPASTLRLHLKRGLVTSVMAFMFFWGLVHVPLAEAIGLSFIAPLIALYLAAVLLGEAVGRRAVLASGIGFTGAMVIVGGKLGGEYSEQASLGIIAILLSALLYAYNLILQRQQAIIAKPFEIAFFQNATVVGIYLLVAPLWAVPPPAALAGELAFTAALGLVSLMLLSWAYARAEARILIPVEYTAFIWAVMLGWLMFGELVTLTTLIGTVLIVLGCLLAAGQR